MNNHIELLSNNSFVAWFLMINFPEGINDEDTSLSEIIEENCTLDNAYIDRLTGYYDGVFAENDGYVDSPNVIQIKLATGDDFSVEFHPGDTIYYINNEEIGCTGPHYVNRKISLKQFFEYTDNIEDREKLFLLPMLKISLYEKEELFRVIHSVLRGVDLQGCSVEMISACIVENCLE